MLPSTNKRMNLGDARGELEQQGFQCFSGDEGDEEEEGILIGRRSNCRLGLGARFDLFFFVHRVTVLNLDRVNEDLANLPDLVEQYSFGGFPPFGFGRGNMIFLIYFADLIDQAALAKIVQEPKKEWCCVKVLAAQDGDGRSHFFESTTSLWGRALYPELHYWAGLLTGRQVGKDGPPGVDPRLVAVNLFCLAILSWHLISSPWLFLWFFFVPMVLFATVAWVIVLIRSWRYHHRHTQSALEVPLYMDGTIA